MLTGAAAPSSGPEDPEAQAPPADGRLSFQAQTGQKKGAAQTQLFTLITNISLFSPQN